eukprot:1092468-Rhodomonas_salina.1
MRPRAPHAPHAAPHPLRRSRRGQSLPGHDRSGLTERSESVRSSGAGSVHMSVMHGGGARSILCPCYALSDTGIGALSCALSGTTDTGASLRRCYALSGADMQEASIRKTASASLGGSCSRGGAQVCPLSPTTALASYAPPTPAPYGGSAYDAPAAPSPVLRRRTMLPGGSRRSGTGTRERRSGGSIYCMVLRICCALSGTDAFCTAKKAGDLDHGFAPKRQGLRGAFGAGASGGACGLGAVVTLVWRSCVRSALWWHVGAPRLPE